MKKANHTGTAPKIEKFFLRNTNKPFTIAQIKSGCKFHPENSGVHHKVNAMLKAGKLVKSKERPFTFTAIPLHMIGESIPPKQSKKNVSKTPDLSLPTPQGLAISEALFAARTAAPLDISGIMQHIINVDEKNKIQENALEAIALILEQAGVIETVK